MEDNIQRIIVFIVALFLLFIFPVYVAYEKKDDISYALALRYTQNFVDEVKAKGYLTLQDYEEYRAKLSVTGNIYDVKMEHKYKRIEPITKYYELDGSNKIIGELTETEYNALPITAPKKLENTYKAYTEIFGTNHIENVLKSAEIYTMNVDDVFSVIIKNTNTTLATVMYNMVTIHASDTNTRIYVNYAGIVSDTKWYGDINKEKYKVTEDEIRDKLLQDKFVLNYQDGAYEPTTPPSLTSDNFSIVMKVKPKKAITIITQGGYNTTAIADKDYIICPKNDPTEDITKMLGVNIGVNGIVCFVTNGVRNEINSIVSYEGHIDEKKEIQIVVKNGIISIYINDERVAYNSYNILGLTLYLKGRMYGNIGSADVAIPYENISEYRVVNTK